MKLLSLALIAPFCLSGCVMVVPVPLAMPVLSGQGAQAVPLRAAPPGTHAAEFGAQVNAQRRAHGLRPLSHNPRLDRVAARHAADMARRGFTGHTGSDGRSPHQRLKAAGYGPCRTGENLADGYRTPARVVREWMASPAHRRINLNPAAREYGVGHHPSGPRWVMMLASPGC